MSYTLLCRRSCGRTRRSCAHPHDRGSTRCTETGRTTRGGPSPHTGDIVDHLREHTPHARLRRFDETGRPARIQLSQRSGSEPSQPQRLKSGEHTRQVNVQRQQIVRVALSIFSLPSIGSERILHNSTTTDRQIDQAKTYSSKTQSPEDFRSDLSCSRINIFYNKSN